MTKAIAVPKPGPMLVWLTRDSNSEQGGLFECVDVWAVLPDRFTDEQGAYWVGTRDEDRLSRVALATAVKRFRTIPDNDRECVRLYVRKV